MNLKIDKIVESTNNFTQAEIMALIEKLEPTLFDKVDFKEFMKKRLWNKSLLMDWFVLIVKVILSKRMALIVKAEQLILDGFSAIMIYAQEDIRNTKAF